MANVTRVACAGDNVMRLLLKSGPGSPPLARTVPDSAIAGCSVIEMSSMSSPLTTSSAWAQ